MILKMILKSFDFQCDFDFKSPFLGDLILFLKSSTYDFAHLLLA